MARIPGVEPSEAGLLARIAYWFVKRKLGRVIMPVKIHAHHSRLLRGVASMQMAQEAAGTLDRGLKCLAEVLVARRVGCPF